MAPEIWSVTDTIFFHFGLFFALLTTNPEKENFEKAKKMPGDIIILHKCTKNHVPNIMIIGYTVPEIGRVMDVIFIFHFGLFFALLPP